MSEFAQLLFTWLIPHLDDWGVIAGSPKQIKAIVKPLSDRPASDFDNALNEMVSQQLIWRYSDEEYQYIQFVKFEKHQDGLHKRTKPKYPLYQKNTISNEEKKFPGTSGNFGGIPPELELEQNKNKNITTTTEHKNLDAQENISKKVVVVDFESNFENNETHETLETPEKFYKDNFCSIFSPTICETIKFYADSGIADDLIIAAMKDAKLKEKNFNYACGTLNNCIASGTFTVEQFEAANTEYKRKKGNGPPGTSKTAQQKGNFEQREYEDSYYENLFENA
jgi:DnaD/phage-associated family protein